jgi:hypothetical protein
MLLMMLMIMMLLMMLMIMMIIMLVNGLWRKCVYIQFNSLRVKMTHVLFNTYFRKGSGRERIVSTRQIFRYTIVTTTTTTIVTTTTTTTVTITTTTITTVTTANVLKIFIIFPPSFGVLSATTSSSCCFLPFLPSHVLDPCCYVVTTKPMYLELLLLRLSSPDVPWQVDIIPNQNGLVLIR